MLYDALVAESRRNDSLDDVRSAALDRVRWLVDLLERQRTEPRWDASAALRGPGEFERIQAIRAATQAEIHGGLAACWLADGRIHEVHPEVSFHALAGGVPPAYAKKTWRGQNLRRSLLAEAGLVLPEELGEADRIPVDDVLDAAAAAWSAHRIALGTANRLPEVPEPDAEGRLVDIRY